MTTSAAPLSAATSASAGSARNPETSLIIAAPSASARRATKALAVSTETGKARRASSGASTASSRAHSSSSPTGTKTGPGRFRADVDDVRPGGGHGLGMASAASAATKRPPSEKESGVTFKTPMTRGAVWNRAASASAAARALA